MFVGVFVEVVDGGTMAAMRVLAQDGDVAETSGPWRGSSWARRSW